MNLKVSKRDDGILYIMRFEIEGKIIHKIGLTTRKPEERLMDILMSFYKVYRYVPKCDIKRFKKVENLHKKETMLLNCFKEFSYNAEKKFSGCTEMFIDIDEWILLDMYDRCIAGEQLGTIEKLEYKQGELEGTLDLKE